MQTYQNLTQSQLRQYYRTKGSLLLLDVPQGLEFGIDNILWKTGSKFKGLKFIPLGCHIISYTLKDENNMFKINKFINFTVDNQIVICKWHPYYSIFIELKGNQAEGYREGVKNYHFDSYLGPYPEGNLQFWRDNTNHITKQVLEKLDPIQKIYKFDQEYQKTKPTHNQQLKMDLDQDSDDDHIQEEQIIEELQQNEMENVNVQEERENGMRCQGKETHNANENSNKNVNKKFQPLSDTIYYCEIPRKLYDEPEHINRVNLDKTQILIEVLSKEWKADPLGILGEIQYAFIYFLIGEDEESFGQWKKLIDLLVFSEVLFCEKNYAELCLNEFKMDKKKLKIVQSFEKLALQLIVVLYNQLKQFPVDFFVDQLSKGNFFQKCLKRLKTYSLTQSQISKKVKKRIQKLLNLLKEKFSYEIQQEDIDEEDKPIIIDYENESYF